MAKLKIASLTHTHALAHAKKERKETYVKVARHGLKSVFVPDGAKVDIHLGHLSGDNNVDRANVKADLGHGRSRIAVVVYSISLG